MKCVDQRRPLGRGPIQGAVTAILLALALLAPEIASEHLDRAGHDHEDVTRVAVDAVHSSLPAHFDAASKSIEQVCSACLLSGCTIVRLAAAPKAEALPPTADRRLAPDAWRPAGEQRRLDLTRAPPRIL